MGKNGTSFEDGVSDFVVDSCLPELGLVSLSDEERRRKVEDVVKMVSQRGFPLFLTCIEHVSASREGVCNL